MPADKDELVVEGLRQNNLKNLSFRIPHDRITAVVGLSGSGKSSLAFDTLFAEGRWRFMESLSTYTRLFLERMDRPELDSIRNIRPAIAVEQKNPVRTSRSTVGTATEINDYLRLFFARVGKLYCPECDQEVRADEPASAADKLLSLYRGGAVSVGFTVPARGRSIAELCEELLKKGFIRALSGGNIIDLSYERPVTLPAEGLDVIVDRTALREGERRRIAEALEAAFREGGGAAWADIKDGSRVVFSRALVCKNCNTALERPNHLALSFNHPVGACPECKGFGNVLRYDTGKVVPDVSRTLNEGAIDPWTKPAYTWWFEQLRKHAARYGIEMDRPFDRLPAKEKKLLFEGTKDFDGIDGFFEYLETKKYKLHIKVFISRYKGQFTCPECDGTRLKKTALNLRVCGRTIAGASRMTIRDAREFFKSLTLSAQEEEISKEVLRQLSAKLEFLSETGLGYLTLDRLTKTLSGGEAQRVSIATQLAASLTGVIYILDEPSIGLHPVDIDMLVRQLKKLSSRGNTVVSVEHEPSIIKASEYIVELGPGAGERGGRIVYSGPTEDFLKNGRTITADYLTGRAFIHTPRWRRNGNGKFLTLKGATGNNLKNIDLKIPLKTLTCVTGVSGSGKSTLVSDTLYCALASHFGVKSDRPLPYRSIEGAGCLQGVKLIDQSPIGRTPRSNPVTYIGGFDHIRKIYAQTNSAIANGLTQSSFSFNVPGGRCESCKGEGVEKLEMYFLPDIYIKCAVCGGKRYTGAALRAKYRGKNIYDCLETTFDEASLIFGGENALQRCFSVIKDVGLGYLKLGQSALTLSGGEAQRLKIAKELIEKDTGECLYIFDEPTTGLHMDDVKRLLSVIGKLVDSGNTVVIIEHNLDCIKAADHVIDLGPGGGESGGNIVASGPPEAIARIKASITGRYLKGVLA